MTSYGIRIGGYRPQVALLSRDEYAQVRKLRPSMRPVLVVNTAACPQVSGRVLQMPAPKRASAR